VVVIFARGPTGNTLWDFVRRKGWGEDVQVVSDADVLMRLVRLGRVGVILCANFNGLGGSVSQLVQVLRELSAHKVTLIVPGQIDTSKISSEVFLDTLDAISEFKHSAAVEATHAGLNAARKRGVKLGRPVKINAYRKDVARLRAQGLSGRAIGKELGIPSSSVFKIIGQLRQGRVKNMGG
jgi:DNA invertase Pin-like site-specific DNA recombinase